MSSTANPQDAARTLDTLQATRAWIEADGKAAVATVIDTWGSSPVPIGGQMVVAADGRFEGSVSGGCVEGEVITEAGEVLDGGKPRTLEFGVADETAWQVGLPCGGKIRVLVERLEKAGGAPLIDRMLAARKTREGLVLDTALADGAKTLHDERSTDADVMQRFSTAKSSIEATPRGEVFRQALVPPPRVLIIGATHIGQVLAHLVKLAGYELMVIDPRTAFAAEARFPGIELVTEWPQDAIPKVGLDAYTAVVALAHVGHIDDEALKLGLRSSAFYVGALGSKRNHAKRIERLTAAGLTPDQIARIKSPIGLDIGAQSPPEIAIAVMAEIVRAVRGPKGKGAGA